MQKNASIFLFCFFWHLFPLNTPWYSITVWWAKSRGFLNSKYFTHFSPVFSSLAYSPLLSFFFFWVAYASSTAAVLLEWKQTGEKEYTEREKIIMLLLSFFSLLQNLTVGHGVPKGFFFFHQHQSFFCEVSKHVSLPVRFFRYDEKNVK